ncbi:hypothetical protein B484DRAFT_431773 [Ochromonadaceae sp. CCMP2298]|nr:hypothetical protein B484DRAFT_431773 [Ochromonadaceae sp. CCMP2298]
MHDHGWKNVVGHMFSCHKAIDRGEFDTAMKAWRLEHAESAAYADAIEHHRWTTYTALKAEVPFRLFSLTGSQLVEQEMSRMKVMAVRHELPLVAINNFISFYQKLLSSQKLVCDTIVAGGAKYTQYASMVCQDHFSDAKHYDVFFRDGGQRDTYEVTRRGQSARTRKVNWRLKTCSCEEAWLQGLPCRHLLSVYRKITAKNMLSAAHFQETFQNIIPDFYVATNYVQGYEYQVGRPILTYLGLDETLPPCGIEAKKRGVTGMKRLLGRHERGFAPLQRGDGRKGKNPYKKTKANMQDKSLETALEKESMEPERELRRADLPMEVEDEVLEEADESEEEDALDLMGLFE